MRKDGAIRWTKNLAVAEFGIAEKTLTGRLRKHGIQPDKDGRYSTSQICKAIFSDIDSEKLRLIREQADKVALENANARRELIPAAEFREVVTKGLGAMLTAINSASNLEREDKDKIIKELRRVGEVVVGVSRNSKASTETDGE